MKKKKLGLGFIVWAVLFIVSLNFSSAIGGEKGIQYETLSVGMKLPHFQLDSLGSSDVEKYLGLKNSEPFCLTQISAKILILEIFSIYCPHCRTQAPILNKIYRLIQENPELSKDIKMIGIAAATDKNKVERWKESLHVPFPLFPDPKSDIWRKVGKPGVPCTLLVTNTGTVLAVHYGATEDEEEFFRQIKNKHMQHK